VVNNIDYHILKDCDIDKQNQIITAIYKFIYTKIPDEYKNEYEFEIDVQDIIVEKE